MSQETAACGDTLQVGEDWELDCARLQHLLGVGKLVAENRARRMILDQRVDAKMNSPRDETREKDEKRWAELAEVDGRENDGESWAVIARRMEKGVRRLVKELPEDEDL